MEELVSEMRQAKDAETFLNAFWRMNKLRRHLYTMITLVNIRHSINTADEFYDAENNYWDETGPQYSVIENELVKAVLEAPFREELLKEIPETYFQLSECSIKAFDPRIVPLMIEENKLTSEYGKLKASAKIEFEGEVLNLSEISAKVDTPDREVRRKAYEAKMAWFKEHSAEFDEIYDKLVKVRHKMAKELGYDNYIQLGYYRMNRLD
ncbi:MAG: M3 family oligoendopeptidase, partial [Solobacterium sp.]|nr:M3 family oligoendopeptidase [Solobacterium sp.]